MTIGVLAQAAGVNVETVRYYQRRGLLDQPVRPLGGARRYDEAALRRLQFIRQCQTLGFTLEEVAELLTLDDGRHCAEASALAAHKLEDVRARLAQLQRIERVLAQLLAQCRRSRGLMRCPLIDALSVPRSSSRSRCRPVARPRSKSTPPAFEHDVHGKPGNQLRAAAAAAVQGAAAGRRRARRGRLAEDGLARDQQ
ncbi:Hg(II)-responsive transcriptional regulator [mine drainage metagenome]|uniref:Mercuric resistance operon regulatory protein n=2 Tax=mine drainage metagenome TaxID=410659 RepID=T0ZE11_9ZZZZ